MCDCYSHKCNHDGCNVEIGMHLEDFETPRNEVHVFCGTHIPQDEDQDNGVLWLARKGVKVFVEALTERAKAHAFGNHPNEYDPNVVRYGAMLPECGCEGSN